MSLSYNQLLELSDKVTTTKEVDGSLIFIVDQERLRNEISKLEAQEHHKLTL